MAERTKPNLDQFAARLTAALGDNLVSLLLFGSAARGTDTEGRSDLNVLLIVKDAGVVRLHAATPALAEWAKFTKPATPVSTAWWRSR